MRQALLTLAITALGTSSIHAARPTHHTVRKGESGASIARSHGLSLSELQSLNPKLDLAHLRVGASLTLRESAPARQAVRLGHPASAPREPPPVPPLPGPPALGPTTLAHLERILPATVRLNPPMALNAQLAEEGPSSRMATLLKPVLPPPTAEELGAPQLVPALAFEPADPRNLDLLWPVETRTVSSNWGPRMRTRTVRVKNHRKKRVRYKGRHRGVDLTAPQGTDVYAAQDGIVLTAGRHRQYGNYVLLDHGHGVTTLYAHHRENLVNEGEVVRRGQKIAEVGRTGNATGPHLHFELRIGGVHQNPLAVLNDIEEIPAELVAGNAQAAPPRN